MRKDVPAILQAHRLPIPGVDNGPWLGLNGAFQLMGPCGRDLRIIASGAEPMPMDQRMGWEHVSVSLSSRCPNWIEMCFAKDLFWEPEEMAIQYHPPKSKYINCHPYVLHLWRPLNFEIPLPPPVMIGPKE